MRSRYADTTWMPIAWSCGETAWRPSIHSTYSWTSCAGNAVLDHSEPLGATLSLLTALHEEDVVAVLPHRDLIRNPSLLSDSFRDVLKDAGMHGILEVGDIPDVGAAIAPQPLLAEGSCEWTQRSIGSLGAGARV